MIKYFAIIVLYYLFPVIGFNQAVAEDNPDGWKLVWSDEFDVDGLPDSKKWTYDVGNGCPNICGWGNNELQYYREASLVNSRIEGGILIIEAHKESTMDKGFTSARIKSTPSGIWQYGKLEIRAKLPGGKGVWPAIWMLPEDQTYGHWPHSGEIDIMEHVGFNPDTIFCAVHTTAFNHMKATQKEGSIYAENVREAWQIYSIIWEEDYIDFQMNNSTYFTFKKTSDDPEKWPFDQPFHLILNLAVGGNWGGREGVDDSIWPQKFEIDYVRVYQREKL